MGKSISLNKSQELLAKVTGGKNVPSPALPNEQTFETSTTQVSGNIEELLAEEKKRLNVSNTVETTEKFIEPKTVSLEDLPQNKVDEINEAISAFTNTNKKEELNNKTISETGSIPQLTVCPRCSWDLTLPNGPEPEYTDKIKFITAMLANKPFQKQYEILNGNLIVVFRTLRPKEIDACYEQIVFDIGAERIKFQGDIIEMVNRYRFYLQLVELKTKSTAGFNHEFPEGFTPKTNKKANSFWELPEILPIGSQGLEFVEDYMVSEIFETESLHRSVAAICRDFNRLVAQMEAMVDNENFWKPTETPS